jgi:hypothetical protein
MQTLFQRCITPEALGGRDAGQVFGAIFPDDWLKVLAEYIINGVEHLPDYYTTADFWNKYGGEFFESQGQSQSAAGLGGYCQRNERIFARSRPAY